MRRLIPREPTVGFLLAAISTFGVFELFDESHPVFLHLMHFFRCVVIGPFEGPPFLGIALNVVLAEKEAELVLLIRDLGVEVLNLTLKDIDQAGVREFVYLQSRVAGVRPRAQDR
ncbi:hypothetical protein [Magnetospirillum sp. UT-4]|uniref:hypothetical protein n=1 Tax=Magnetospirillum sp. UT-4 TaxID=2681467 RepID=UPI001573B349|nr:hypothetical protein [Magnetospirillum sp. UT-4]